MSRWSRPHGLGAVLATGVAAALSALVAGGSAGGAPAGAAGSGANPAASTTLPPGDLTTGLWDPALFAKETNVDLALSRTRAAGATAVRLILYWQDTVPNTARKPADFEAQNPADPHYRWAAFDRQVQRVTRAGLVPIVGVQLAPAWAERGEEGDAGTRRPDPAEYGAFARAAATRYNGLFSRGLPRVRYWQVWNEPNFTLFLNPPSAEHYRRLVNAFADAVHGVRRDNVVIAGGTSPFGYKDVAVAPLRFMRDLLCMSAGATPKPTCNTQVRFDVWTHHPYTTGGPTRKAAAPDDASLGDLPEMRRLLLAAARAGHVFSRQKLRFWVTEFSWDSRPPDPQAVPSDLHARWVAEALYRMWRSGISLVTWFQLRDDPIRVSQFQSGLYLESGPGYRLDRPKLALRAFRFPFVAFSERNGVLVWGRLPAGNAGPVYVEGQVGRGWKRIATLRSNAGGIFTTRVRASRSVALRARLPRGRDVSVPFSLKRPADLQVWPFGCGGILSCG